MADKEDLTEQEKTVFQLRLDAIRNLPPEEQAAAIEALSKDYEGIRGRLKDELEMAYSDMQTAMPQGVTAGRQYHAASPLSHLSSALRQTWGGMEAGRIGKERRGLEEMYGQGIGDMLRSGITQTAVPDIQQQDPYLGGQSSQDDISGLGMSVQPQPPAVPDMTMGGPAADNFQKPNAPSMGQGMPPTPPAAQPGPMPQQLRQPSAPVPPVGGMPPMAPQGPMAGTSGTFSPNPMGERQKQQQIARLLALGSM